MLTLTQTHCLLVLIHNFTNRHSLYWCWHSHRPTVCWCKYTISLIGIASLMLTLTQTHCLLVQIHNFTNRLSIHWCWHSHRPTVCWCKYTVSLIGIAFTDGDTHIDALFTSGTSSSQHGVVGDEGLVGAHLHQVQRYAQSMRCGLGNLSTGNKNKACISCCLTWQISHAESHTHTHTHTHTHPHTHACMHARMHARTHARTHTHTHRGKLVT